MHVLNNAHQLGVQNWCAGEDKLISHSVSCVSLLSTLIKQLFHAAQTLTKAMTRLLKFGLYILI